jgi:preprotein translocase SecE subunit
MARQTRQQRRARRGQAQPALAGGPPTPPPPAPRPTASAGDSEPSRRPERAIREGRRFPGVGTIHFIRESWGELKKVEWPKQRAVVSGTAVVLVACTIVGTYLYLNDRLWQYVVHHVLLR